MGCGHGRFASALRNHSDGEPLSRCRVQIGSHSGSEGAVAATPHAIPSGVADGRGDVPPASQGLNRRVIATSSSPPNDVSPTAIPTSSYPIPAAVRSSDCNVDVDRGAAARDQKSWYTRLCETLRDGCGVGGTAEEKIPATIQNIAAWPIPGLVVFAGGGFSDNMRSYLHSTGKAVAFEDLESWLRLFFGWPEAEQRS